MWDIVTVMPISRIKKRLELMYQSRYDAIFPVTFGTHPLLLAIPEEDKSTTSTSETEERDESRGLANGGTLSPGVGEPTICPD